MNKAHIINDIENKRTMIFKLWDLLIVAININPEKTKIVKCISFSK
jgi:hypothetical protein